MTRRRVFTPELKARVVLEIISEAKVYYLVNRGGISVLRIGKAGRFR